jgi:hypothetical protein
LPPTQYGNKNAQGIKHTQEWKNAASARKLGHPSYTKGMKFSDETKKKMSQSQKGISKGHKGKTWKIINGKRVWMDKTL